MRRIILLTALTLHIGGYAQDDVTYEATTKVTLKKGADVKASRRSTITDMIGYDERGFYALKGSYSMLQSSSDIQFYDKNYALINEEEFRPEVGGKKSIINNIIMWDKEIYVFHNYKDGKTKLNTLYVQKVDKKSLELTNDIIEIASIDFSGKMKFNAGSFSSSISIDSTKLLVYYQLPYDNGEPERFGFHVFDTEMKEIWSKDVILPYEEELFQVADFSIGDDGSVYLTGKLYNEKVKEKVRGQVNYKYVILSYKNNGEDFKEYEMDIEDKFITDVKIAALTNGDIACAGFYSDKGSYSMKGSCYLRIDGATGNILHTSTSEFGIDFLTQNLTEKQEKKVKKKEAKGKSVELFNYDLDNLIIRSDGGVVLVGEQYYVRVVTTTTTSANGGTTTRTDYHYYYNDIVVVNISPAGDIEWTQKIAKRQHSVNDGGYYSSYALMVYKDKLYFFFNDSPRNLSYTGTGKVYNMPFKKSVVTMVEVNAEGDVMRESLFSMKESEVMTRPKVCEQISPNKMILFGEYKKTHRFTEVQFK